jgi:hypothetical protein
MHRKLFVLFLVFFAVQTEVVNGQGLSKFADKYLTMDRFDYSAQVGFSNYIGELNSNVTPIGNNINLGASVRYTFNRNKIHISDRSWAARLDVNYLGLDGEAPEIHANPSNAQNFQFSNNVFEFFGAGEFNFLDYRPNRVKRFTWTPYVFGGVGMAFHNPVSGKGANQFNLIDEGIEFKKLVLKNNPSNSNSVDVEEFQEVDLVDSKNSKYYSKSTIIIPFGAGVKWYVKNGFSVGLEVNYRYTFSDFLDGVGNGKYEHYPVVTNGVTGTPDYNDWNSKRIEWEKRVSPTFGGIAAYNDLVNKEQSRGRKGNDFYMTTAIKLTFHLFSERDPLW